MREWTSIVTELRTLGMPQKDSQLALAVASIAFAGPAKERLVASGMDPKKVDANAGHAGRAAGCIHGVADDTGRNRQGESVAVFCLSQVDRARTTRVRCVVEEA